MTRALWGLALLSCEVWHLVPWLAERAGWWGTQSHPCSVGQLGIAEWRRVVFYHWGGYMLTHIITDLPPKRSTSQTAYPMKCSQNLRCISCHRWKQQWSSGLGYEGDRGTLLPGPGQMALTPRCTGAAVNRSQGNFDSMLRSLDQTKFMPPNPDQTWKVLRYKCSFACTIQFSGRCPA